MRVERDANKKLVLGRLSGLAGNLVSRAGWGPARLRDGKFVEEISLEEARRVVAEHGLPLPEGM